MRLSYDTGWLTETMERRVITASELAGFIAAHAVWCVSDTDALTPMLAFTTEDGRRLERLAGDDVGAAVELGQQRLKADPHSADDGVLAYDGRIHLDDGPQDAILLEMRSYAFPWAKATLAVPYTPRRSGQFRVHKPKLIEWNRCEDFDMHAAFDAFFRGVAEHEQGAKVWEEALDESR